jgi:hypothetical protein
MPHEVTVGARRDALARLRLRRVRLLRLRPRDIAPRAAEHGLRNRRDLRRVRDRLRPRRCPGPGGDRPIRCGSAEAIAGGRVVAVKLCDEKLELARSLGAEFTINATREDPQPTLGHLALDSPAASARCVRAARSCRGRGRSDVGVRRLVRPRRTPAVSIGRPSRVSGSDAHNADRAVDSGERAGHRHRRHRTAHAQGLGARPA